MPKEAPMKKATHPDLMTLDLPEATCGPWQVSTFEVPEHSLANLREALNGGRQTKPGTYTKLTKHGQVWMSDTDAEKRDHLEPLWKLEKLDQGSFLMGGLGLGMVLQAALQLGTLASVDCLEIDPCVIQLMGPHYQELAAAQGVKLTIHLADALTKKWAPGSHWDVAWWDIWPDLCTDNLEQMTKLRRSYAKRTTWQGCWGQELLKAQKRRDQRQGWWS
jgi:hypothetical protein